MPNIEGLRYPSSTDTPDVPRDVQNLATDVAARTPYAFAEGTVNVTTTGTPASGTAAITFPVGRFSASGSTVRLVATIVSAAAGSSTAVVRVTAAATNTGATLGVSNSTAGTYAVSWIAIQDNP